MSDATSFGATMCYPDSKPLRVGVAKQHFIFLVTLELWQGASHPIFGTKNGMPLFSSTTLESEFLNCQDRTGKCCRVLFNINNNTGTAVLLL